MMFLKKVRSSAVKSALRKPADVFYANKFVGLIVEPGFYDRYQDAEHLGIQNRVFTSNIIVFAGYETAYLVSI